MKHKRSYYKDGFYIDVTTGNKYQPKSNCEICGSSYRLTVHHYLEQQKCMRDLEARKVIFPNMWTQEFINENQKLFTLCLKCHTRLHSSQSTKDLLEEWDIDRNKYIYKEN